MIKDHQKFKLIDLNNKPAGIVEVNWNPKDESTNECKVLKFIYPDGSTSFVERKILNELLFVIGKPEDQRKMIPQTIKRVRWHETVLSVKAHKDIRKGENITFPIKITLPSIEEEVIGELAKQLKVPKGLITKK
jgi:hypothetical protein